MTSPPESDPRFLRELNIEFLVHELKDPLAVIEAGLRCLLEKPERYGPLTERQANTLQRTLRSARRAGALLGDLLEVGRAEAACGRPDRFRPLESVHQALRDALETVAGPEPEPVGAYRTPCALEALLRRHGIVLRAAAGADALEMVQDEAQFRRMAGNLMKNALHHRRERVEVDLDVEPGRLILRVSDDGPGVGPADRERIFRRYAQAAPGPLARRGHGLGLAGALLLARCLGGDIRVDERPGGGACFTLIVPLRAPGGEDGTEGSRGQGVEGSRGR
jgi:signal transduction histidine kinase